MGDVGREVMQEQYLGFGVIVRALASILSKRRSRFRVLRKGVWWPVKVNEALYPGDGVGNRYHQERAEAGTLVGRPFQESRRRTMVAWTEVADWAMRSGQILDIGWMLSWQNLLINKIWGVGETEESRMALSFLTEELNGMKLLLHGWQDREEVERTSSCRCRSDILREMGSRRSGAKSRGVSQRYKPKIVSIYQSLRLGDWVKSPRIRV